MEQDIQELDPGGVQPAQFHSIDQMTERNVSPPAECKMMLCADYSNCYSESVTLLGNEVTKVKWDNIYCELRYNAGFHTEGGWPWDLPPPPPPPPEFWELNTNENE